MPPWRYAQFDDGPPIHTAVTEKETRHLERFATGKRVLEIGAFEGWSTIAMARVADSVTTIDPFEDVPSGTREQFHENLRAYGVEDRVTLIQDASERALPDLFNAGERFDFVFIDGDHEAAVRNDAAISARLAPDGILAFHDCDEGMTTVQPIFREHFGEPDEIIDSIWIAKSFGHKPAVSYMPGTVALCYCYGELIRAPFMSSVIGVLSHDRGRRIKGTVSVGCLYIADSRNHIVFEFLQSNLEWLWFLDTDIEFAPETLDQLLEATDGGERKIVSAPYWTEDPERGPFVVWYRLEEDGFRAYADIPATGVLEVAACGMGCCLIHRDVLTAMWDQPHNPDDPWIWFSHDLVEMANGPIRAGEDFSFCLRAYRLGFRTYGVADIKIEHYKVRPQVRPQLGTAVSRHEP